MKKFNFFQILIALGFLCAGKINAQPTIFFQPNYQGVITSDVVNYALNQHFGGGDNTYKNPNRGKAFIPAFGTGVTEIGAHAFWYCSLMVLTSLPATVTKIDGQAFGSCSTIRLTSLPEGLTEIHNAAFEYCYGLTTLTIPSRVTTVHNDAFLACTGLTTVTFTSGYTNTLTIRPKAFASCSKLTKVTLPTMVISIGNEAFRNCSSLLEVHIAATTPPTLGTTPFLNIPSICRLCVVDNAAVAAYSNSPWISTFGSRISACYIGIEEYIPNNTVSIYPNPSTSEFTVSFELEKSCNMQILLCDVLGSELMEIYDGFATVGTFTKTVNTENLTKGVYFLKILIDGNSTVEKIIVE